MFDFGKFINDIGTNVDNFWHPKKKKEDVLPVATARTQPTLQVAKPQAQPNLTVQSPQDFSNRFDTGAAPLTVAQPKPQATPVVIPPKPTVPKVNPDGTVPDNRPMPARVPNDDFDKANRTLKYSKTSRDKDNYIGSDADKLRAELAKPNPDKALVRGLTQSVKNRTVERGQAEIKEDQAASTAGIIGDIVSGKTVRDAAGEVGKTILQGVARIPETVVRSTFLEPLVGNATRTSDKAISTASDENTGIREFLYGKDAVKSYQEQARDAQVLGKELKKSDNGFAQAGGNLLDTPLAPFIAPALAALDLTGVAKAGLPGTKAAVEFTIKQAEKAAGRKFTAKEAADVSKRVEAEVAQSAADAVKSPTYTPKQAAGADIMEQLDNIAKTGEEFSNSFKINNPGNANISTNGIQPLEQKITDSPYSNSLENDPSGEKPGGIERAKKELQDGTALPVRVRTLPDGTKFIEDGRHRIEAGRQLGIDVSEEDVTHLYQPNMGNSFTKAGDVVDLERFRKGTAAFEPKKFGVQDETYKRLVDRYGEQNAQNILNSSSDATNIKNMDAFVTSEAKKRYGNVTVKSKANADATAEANIADTRMPVAKETVKMVGKDGSDITQNLAANEKAIKEAQAAGDTDTAAKLQMKQLADLEDAKVAEEAPVDTSTPAQIVAQNTAKLPNSSDAVADDIPNIEKTMEDTNAHITGFGENTTPEARAKMAAEIAEHDRTGAPLSAESKAMYEEYVKPIVDSMYGKSKRSQEGKLGQKEYYLPEEKAGSEAKSFSPFGRGWIDEANLEFGHAMRREGKIDTADLNDPVNALHNYTEQFYNDNYGHLSPENIAEAKLRGVEKPDEYIKGRQELADKVDKSLVREVNLNVKNTKEKLKHSSNIVGDIQRNFDNSGGDPTTVITLDAKLPPVAKARTNRKISQKVTAGINEDAYSAFGMKQYESARAQGNKAFAENFTGEDDLPEYAASLRGYYEPVFDKDFSKVMSKQRFDDMVDSAAVKSFDEQDPAAIQKLERNLAIEKAIYSSEHIRYSDKKVQEQINREVTHMLRDGKLPQTIARKVTDEFTKITYTGALGLNPLSAIQNLTELSRVAGLTAKGDTLATLKTQLKDATIPKIRETLAEYGVTNGRIEQELAGSLSQPGKSAVSKGVRIAGKGRDKVNDFVMSGFDATDSMKNYAMIKALEIKHADIQNPRLRTQAIMDDFNANSLLGGHYGNIEATNRNNFTRAALQFGSYTMRDWGQIAEMAKKGDWGYVARTLGTRAGIALPMYALFGTTLAYTLGVNEYKGGPIISLATNTFAAMNDEAARVQDEIDSGKDASFDWSNVRDQLARKQGALAVPAGNYLLNKLGVQDLFGDSKDADYLRHDTAIGDMKQGYNANKEGRPRFAAPQTPWSTFKSIIGGSYNSDEAGKYFGKDLFNNPQLYGIFDTNNQKYTPVGTRYQTEIEKQSKIMNDPATDPVKKGDARNEIARLIDTAYTDQDLKNTFFKENPDAANIYKSMTATTFNPQTHKRESDVITPERWNAVSSDKSGKLYDFLKQRAERNNAEFDDPIDPIYQLTDRSKINEILGMRAAFTGDDRERRATLREQQWYKDFEKAQSDYYDKKGTVAADPNSDFGNTARAQKYFELSNANPSYTAPKSDVLAQYEAIRNSGNEAERKAFYAANADQLGAEYEERSARELQWTNQMRALEGAEPITADVWNNKTYGYKTDTSGGSSNSYGNNSNSDKVVDANFGSRGASPRVSIGKNYKAATVKIKSKRAKSKVNSVKIKKK